MCVPYGMWGLKTQHVIQSGKENHCIVEISWSWKNKEHLFHLCLSWNSCLTADTETDQLLLQHFPDLATGFSTPAGIFQREAVTQRRCAIIVVKSGAARAPIQLRRHQSDPQSLTRRKTRLVETRCTYCRLHVRTTPQTAEDEERAKRIKNTGPSSPSSGRRPPSAALSDGAQAKRAQRRRGAGERRRGGKAVAAIL